MTNVTIVYNWEISRLQCLSQAQEGADYVVTADWRLTKTEGQYEGTVFGTCLFPVMQGETFVPYADLTLSIVLGWCWVNGVDRVACETAVDQQIAMQVNPPIVTLPLPWASSAIKSVNNPNAAELEAGLDSLENL